MRVFGGRAVVSFMRLTLLPRRLLCQVYRSPYWFDNPEGPPNDRDSAPFVPKSVVISPYFDWGNERPPRRPLEETIIYEAHVKGFTIRHPDIPEALRGTYAGLGHPAAIEYLVKLGVTAEELMPVHQFVHG